LFCFVSPRHLELTHFLLAVVLLIIALGIFPAVTAVPLAYICVSFAWSCSLPDGGEQVASVVSTLLVPIGLTDPRLSHFSVSMTRERPPAVPRVVIAAVSMILLRLQISVIYLDACLGKLSSPAWADGSALYYWVRHPNFGPPDWLSPLLLRVTSEPWASLGMAWGTLALEFGLGISMFLSVRVRLTVLLPAGVLFHLAIAVVLGISSFAVVMVGALVLLLVPPGSSWTASLHPSLRRPKWRRHVPA
jgi:antimicrobial peptide system SdpB family protein